jgi:cell division protease FtsH
VTTGAQNDIERATAIARDMVTKWGLTEGMGPLAYQEAEGEVFLGQAVTQRQQIADQTARQIDEEDRAIVERNYERARRLLNDNLKTLHAMADALMRYETLDAEQIDDLMNGREPRPPEQSNDRRGSARRPNAGTGKGPRPTGIPAPQTFAARPMSTGRQAFNPRAERDRNAIGDNHESRSQHTDS